jgi:exodeoxyribonuclease VII small subunit
MMDEKDKEIKLPDDLKFEQALTQLEEIVDKLESGEMELEECLEKFKLGATLARFCETRLNETAKQLEILRKTGPNTAEFQPLNENSNE